MLIVAVTFSSSSWALAEDPALLRTLTAHFGGQLQQTEQFRAEDGTLITDYAAQQQHYHCHLRVGHQDDEATTQEIIYQGPWAQLPQGLRQDIMKHKVDPSRVSQLDNSGKEQGVLYEQELPHGSVVCCIATEHGTPQHIERSHIGDYETVRVYYKVSHQAPADAMDTRLGSDACRGKIQLVSGGGDRRRSRPLSTPTSPTDNRARPRTESFATDADTKATSSTTTAAAVPPPPVPPVTPAGHRGSVPAPPPMGYGRFAPPPPPSMMRRGSYGGFPSASGRGYSPVGRGGYTPTVGRRPVPPAAPAPVAPAPATAAPAPATAAPAPATASTAVGTRAPAGATTTESDTKARYSTTIEANSHFDSGQKTMYTSRQGLRYEFLRGEPRMVSQNGRSWYDPDADRVAHILCHNSPYSIAASRLGGNHSYLTDTNNPSPSTPHPDPIRLIDEIYDKLQKEIARILQVEQAYERAGNLARRTLSAPNISLAKGASATAAYQVNIESDRSSGRLKFKISLASTGSSTVVTGYRGATATSGYVLVLEHSILNYWKVSSFYNK